MSIITESLIS